MPVYRLDPEYLLFPSPEDANEEGLLAVGGLLREDWILRAYEHGIFPWFNEDDPILWWSVDPRSVLFLDDLIVHKSMRPYINSETYSFKMDTAFELVMRSCADAPGRGPGHTWIGEDMIRVYTSLHRMGFAHSAEIWEDNVLVGGLYGLSLGKVFFGESMFSNKSNMSKLALFRMVEYLRANDFEFVDCQVPNDHLKNLGAKDIERSTYLNLLRRGLSFPNKKGQWTLQ
jgi:leucyl/phenylalanyl-tRNA--protein transferase